MENSKTEKISTKMNSSIHFVLNLSIFQNYCCGLKFDFGLFFSHYYQFIRDELIFLDKRKCIFVKNVSYVGTGFRIASNCVFVFTSFELEMTKITFSRCTKPIRAKKFLSVLVTKKKKKQVLRKKQHVVNIENWSF